MQPGNMQQFIRHVRCQAGLAHTCVYAKSKAWRTRLMLYDPRARSLFGSLGSSTASIQMRAACSSPRARLLKNVAPFLRGVGSILLMRLVSDRHTHRSSRCFGRRQAAHTVCFA